MDNNIIFGIIAISMMDAFKKRCAVARYIIRRVVLWPYLFVRTRNLVWNKINRPYLEAYKSHEPNFNNLQRQILDILETDGITITHMNEFMPESGLLKDMQELSERMINPEGVGRKKTFLNYFFEEKNAKNLSNPFVKFALDERILEIAGAYFKMHARLKFFSGNITRPVSEGEDAKGSQRWHRDPGIKRILKVFLYVNDVPDKSAGPFTYIKGSQPGGRYGNIFKQILFGEEGYYPKERAVEKKIPRNAVQICTGSAGTIVFCNTLGLHKGGYSTTKERIMFTAMYKHNPSNIPADKKYPENFDEEFAKLSSVQKLAVTNQVGLVK